MLRRFETLIDPFPPGDGRPPPAKLFAFVYYYSRPALPWLALMALFTAALSAIEIYVLNFTGRLVDWLAHATPGEFFADHGGDLWVVGVVVLVLFPLFTLGASVLQFQTTFGPYPMLVRWMAHRFMLGQSLAFFQDEFAGRVSQKVMQTALAVRDSVTRVMDVGVYIVTYFAGTVALLAASDLWFVAAMAVWLAGYVALLVYYVPRLGVVGEQQADARAQMTGRIVDSYTNIQTIKLFAHSDREQAYARSAMQDAKGNLEALDASKAGRRKGRRP